MLIVRKLKVGPLYGCNQSKNPDANITMTQHFFGYLVCEK